MRSSLDFGSLSSLASTLLGLVLVSLVAVGIRLVFMQVVQRRRERENRQINERLKTLIAAYKTLGGSFTGSLAVDPSHLRELRARAQPAPAEGAGDAAATGVGADAAPISESASDRRRRIRDAVEAALADVILLGTEEQVRMAAQAACDMVAGRSVQVGPLVASLRAFIRQALDLEPVAKDVVIPEQGPLRPASGSTARRGAAGGSAAGGGGGGRGAGQGGGMGMGMGVGAGAAGAHHAAGGGDLPGDPESTAGH
ncbi:hypothetical protein [Variovorax sp.]|uniref:hypothetical protein n=1 Tax=Variovorax sp. TaxID=1871043 RepID=UPI002D713B98|nr:hypothetical protein [Variovorax sp.]HYP84420.1 hypothetical protein [Variovorax sp.]